MYQKLRQVREASSTNQLTLSNLLGYSSKNAYSQKERGERKFTVEEALKISNYFKIPVEDLFSEDVAESDMPIAS